MSLLNLKRQIDYNVASITYKEWALIKREGGFLYFIPKGKGSKCLLRVPEAEADIVLNYAVKNPVGDIVKEERKKQALSQRELSSRSGVSQMTISNVEKGTCEKINSDTLDAILRTLNIPLDDVYKLGFK